MRRDMGSAAGTARGHQPRPTRDEMNGYFAVKQVPRMRRNYIKRSKRLLLLFTTFKIISVVMIVAVVVSQ